jgi:fatty acid desaturase
MHVSSSDCYEIPEALQVSVAEDPRSEMAARLPHVLQPFLTWLTAKPAPGEDFVTRAPGSFVWEAVLLVVLGTAASALALAWLGPRHFGCWLLLPVGLLATSSGLGLFQVVIFHHCAHGTVFSTRPRNRLAGRLVSALLLFKHFDAYQSEHMQHHSAKVLFTDDDEFTGFVVGLCEMRAATTRRGLWRRLVWLLVSPVFHARFLRKRLAGSMASGDAVHNAVAIGFCGGVVALGVVTHTLLILAIAWFLPLTILLQIATVFRILCEHRLPAEEVIEQRGRQLVCEATAGVFPGAAPPSARLPVVPRLAAWCAWWANMLTLQLFVRVFVLVGDAPCHDFHHRRPGKKWVNYVHARQADLAAGCPGFPLNYVDSWGLFAAIDQNFAAMERAPGHVLGGEKREVALF